MLDANIHTSIVGPLKASVGINHVTITTVEVNKWHTCLHIFCAPKQAKIIADAINLAFAETEDART